MLSSILIVRLCWGTWNWLCCSCFGGKSFRLIIRNGLLLLLMIVSFIFLRVSWCVVMVKIMNLFMLIIVWRFQRLFFNRIYLKVKSNLNNLKMIIWLRKLLISNLSIKRGRGNSSLINLILFIKNASQKASLLTLTVV